MSDQYRFKCQCGQVHSIDMPPKSRETTVQCRVAPVLRWDGKSFMIVRNASEDNLQPYEDGHWLHDFAIGGRKYNHYFFWGKWGWPLRVAITIAVRVWRYRIKAFGWKPLRGYWHDSNMSLRTKGKAISEKEFIEKGRREEAD